MTPFQPAHIRTLAFGLGLAVVLLVGLVFLARTLARPTQSDLGPGQGAETSSINPATNLDEEMMDIFQTIRAGWYDAARLRLQRHLLKDPDNAHAHFLFGLTFHRELRYARARTHFERAIELMPGFHPTYHFYGYCLYYLGELEAARAAFEQHLAAVPSEGDSHFGLGLIELDENNLPAAAERFRTAIELDERRDRIDGVSKAHARLGETYERKGDLESARDHLVLATDLYPDHYEAFYLLYRILLRLGDEEAAEEALAAHDEAKQRVRPEPPTAPGE